jgi:hypothetical protein
MPKIEIPCPKCAGKGSVPYGVSRGNAGGICFECKGARIIKVDDAATAARREIIRREHEAKRIARRNASRGPLLPCYAVTYLVGTWQAMTLDSYYDLADAVEHVERIRRRNPSRPGDWTIEDSTNYADAIH